MIYKCYLLVRYLLFPILKLTSFFVKKIKERMEFENFTYIGIKNKKYDFAVEVSSEGELEQVYYLLEQKLLAGNNIELIYCSPSVKNTCYKLIEKFPDQINAVALPLIKFVPNHPRYDMGKWIKSDLVLFCRYDFFPELIFGFKQRKKEMVLISGSLKNFEQKHILVKTYLKNCYKEFSKIVAASESEEVHFSNLGIVSEQIMSYDFRIPRILQRLERREKVFLEKGESFALFTEFVKSRTEHKIILGSLWPIDTFLLKGDLSGSLICIVPHSLNEKNIELILTFINKKVFVVSEKTTKAKLVSMIEEYQNTGGIWLLTIKGILCELYSLFDKAYVGGGFGVSVHSLLEPYLAGCEVFCGSKIHRSTEFDWIRSQNQKMPVLLDLDEDFETLKKSDFKNEKESYNRSDDLRVKEEWPFRRS